jgi:hypothetical protein
LSILHRVSVLLVGNIPSIRRKALLFFHEKGIEAAILDASKSLDDIVSHFGLSSDLKQRLRNGDLGILEFDAPLGYTHNQVVDLRKEFVEHMGAREWEPE